MVVLLFLLLLFYFGGRRGDQLCIFEVICTMLSFVSNLLLARSGSNHAIFCSSDRGFGFEMNFKV